MKLLKKDKYGRTIKVIPSPIGLKKPYTGLNAV